MDGCDGNVKRVKLFVSILYLNISVVPVVT